MSSSNAPLRRATSTLVAFLCSFNIAGCKKDEPASSTSGGTTSEHKHQADEPKSGGDKPSKDDHGVLSALGSVKVGAWILNVAMAGDLAPGAENAFEVKMEGGTGEQPAVYLSLVGADDTIVSAPAKGIAERGGLHFHVAVPRSASPEAVVLRVRGESLDESAKLALPGARKGAPVGPHDGFMARLAGGQTLFTEVKLHDDAGDIEVWLTSDVEGKTPFDVALTTRPTLTFTDLGGRVVELAPRDSEKNPDEDGHGNIRDGKTNYFIFPGASGADATAFKGADFRSRVTITVTGPSGVSTGDLALRPHVHHGAGAHGHDHGDKHEH